MSPRPNLGRWTPAFAALSSIIWLQGCGGNPLPEASSRDHIDKVAKAYLKANDKLKRAPRDAEELKPFLKELGDPEALLISPNDHQPFVIIWGTDPNAGKDLKPGVIAYEKEGRRGQRYVFTAMGVMMMSDQDFATANFPKGHK